MPVELTLKLFAARRLANHDGSGCRSLVESGGDFITAGGELGSVHIASVGKEEAAAFKQSCQQATMLVRRVDAKRAVLEVDPTRCDGVVVVETTAQFRVLQESSMCDLGPATDIANVYRPRFVGGGRCKTQCVDGNRQVRTRTARKAGNFFHAVAATNEDVVKIRQELK